MVDENKDKGKDDQVMANMLEAIHQTILARAQQKIAEVEVVRKKFRNEHLQPDDPELVKLTEILDEHPEEYDLGPCYCALCRSYNCG